MFQSKGLILERKLTLLPLLRSVIQLHVSLEWTQSHMARKAVSEPFVSLKVIKIIQKTLFLVEFTDDSIIYIRSEFISS